MDAGYDAIKSHIISAHTGTLPVLTEAASLLQRRGEVEMKQRVFTAFRDHFVMSDAEVAALTSTAEPVDERFFQSLARAKRIIQDCEILLGFEKQTLGSDLVEQKSKYIDFGFQRLYKWVQREFKSLNLENPHMNSAIRRALRVLAERPSLFQNCLDYFAEARERILSDAFHIALTGNASSGEEDASLKPIDLAAHDSLRYVGDMLAWIHSAAVNEREALEVLFVAEGEELAKGMKSGRHTEIWCLVADEGDDGEFNALKALNDLVDRDVAGVSRILRQRVEQVIRSNEETITAYKLAALIIFYRVTFQKLLGIGSNLFDCVESLEKEALRQFRALVRDHIVALEVEFQQPPSELGPPWFLSNALTRLEAIMKTFESSLAASEDRECEFTNVLVEAFQPFMSGCENMAMAIEPPSNAIFLINCKLAAAKILKGFDFTRGEAARIREGISSEVGKLVAFQHHFFCGGSGLGPLLERGQGALNDSEKEANKELLERASRQLDKFLPSALIDAIENLKHLQDLTLARDITEAAASQFCEDFQRLENLVEERDRKAREANKSGLRSVFPRTTAEIRVLLL